MSETLTEMLESKVEDWVNERIDEALDGMESKVLSLIQDEITTKLDIDLD